MTETSDLHGFWEDRYSSADQIWSGRVNAVLKDVARNLTPGTALDLGCGEGGDAIWLAQNGWNVTGVDLSTTATQRANEAALAAGIPSERFHFEAADLTEWSTEERFDLVTASFLLSWPIEIPRDAILERATQFVAPGGHILVVAHAAPPPWSEHAHSDEHQHGDGQAGHSHGPKFPTPESDLAVLSLDPAKWEVLTVELRERSAQMPDGTTTQLDDTVVLAKRVA